ncbi:hypothetical protein OP10G_0533 [Fimbriimonas ginsengisoli Gsoil 348]|uniref:Uncharacterized protein n=1 Tax=Fimbriimonas ginsengisoli Gsoil 348 TaxID=661478 RepID=A0A068NK76_FIMGI|nr:hypothetical protein OP10G_0533 [Fimbriimonas ginsengisoli Gsoil 348]
MIRSIGSPPVNPNDPSRRALWRVPFLRGFPSKSGKGIARPMGGPCPTARREGSPILSRSAFPSELPTANG